jgi:hypothetical protein
MGAPMQTENDERPERTLNDGEKQSGDPQAGVLELPTEDWKAKVDRLTDVVCLLLMKNQRMRMALSTHSGDEQSDDSF